MAIVGRSVPNVPYVGRGSLADAPVLTTPGPIVSTVPGKRGRPIVVLLRGALADDPVLTTQAPLVVARQPPRPVAVVYTARSSTEDAVVGQAAATPGPIVLTPAPRPRPGVAALIRGTLADDPVLTTAAPIVLAPPVRPRPGVAWTARGSLVDLATPAPIVVVAPAARRPAAAIIWVRGSLDDPSPAVPPQPIVVATCTAPRVGRVVAVRPPAATDVPPPVLGPDAVFTLDQPELRWTAGTPSARWATGPAGPDSRWRADPPEV